MRFDTLLAQYLYQYKILNLPGIGTFEADNTVYPPDENEKQKPSLEGITFRSSNITTADDSLIDFIKEHTGKMKPLAMSDLESYLTLGKQFLYIGKPFYLEGIGTLQLTKAGRFEFLPGEYVTTKLEDPNVERSEGKSKAVLEEDRIRHESNNNTLKKVFLAMAILGGIALIGWGALTLYNRNMMGSESATTADSTGTVLNDQVMPAADSMMTLPEGTDSAIILSQPTADTALREAYKFVVETTPDKLRATNRYNDLHSYGNKIMIESPDSVVFKLYYIIRTTPSDTLRIRDSLNRWYYRNSTENRVRIENP